MESFLFRKFGFSQNSELFTRLGRRVDKGLYIILASAGSIIFGLGNTYLSIYQSPKEPLDAWAKVVEFLCHPLIIIILGTLLILVGVIGTYKDQDRQQRENKSLKSENALKKQLEEELNSWQETNQQLIGKISELQTELVTIWLKSVAKQFKFTSTDRITIYYENNNGFHFLARHSQNPTYCKAHRQKFPINQGVISKAWQHGHHVEFGCPHEKEGEAYHTFLLDNYGYDRAKVDALTMKSCRYLAISIVDADEPKGVIVFESTEEGFLGGKKKDNLISFCRENQGYLAKFVRDSLNFDFEVQVAKHRDTVSVEDDFSHIEIDPK